MSYLNLNKQILPKVLKHDNQPLLIKSGETEIIEIGRVIEMRLKKTSLGYKALIINLHVGASINQPYFSPQIEDWRVSKDDIEEVLKNLKKGMLITVQGVRRTFVYLNDKYNCETFQHINVVSKISILSDDESFLERFKKNFKKEFISHDESIKP